MIPIVKICNFNDSTVSITDYTLDSNEYVPENLNDPEQYLKNKFKYSETCTINIIEKITTDKSEYIDTIYTSHCSYLDEAYYTFKDDGYYIVHHVILPTTEWLKQQKELDKSINIYVTDGLYMYLYIDGVLNEKDSSVIAEINTENTTISRIDINQFSILNIYKCYISLCKRIYENIIYKCKTISTPFIFNRDFIWMTINVLKYYVEFDQLSEALRLLEEINYCGGICNEQLPNLLKNSLCGCNK